MDMTRRDMAMRRREMRDMARRDREMRDGRNPYGSRGGYVTSRDPRRRDRAMEDMARGRGRDYGMGDYNYSDSEYDSRYSDRAYSKQDSARGRRDYESGRQYDRYGVPFELYGEIDMAGGDYARRRNSRGQYTRDKARDGHYPMMPYPYMDFGGDDYNSGQKLSQEELEDWYEELCQEIPEQYKSLYKKDNIEKIARQMQIEFEKFSPLELAVTTTMLATDYSKSVGYSDINKLVIMAKEWLCDKDSGLKYGERLATYYDEIING